ncbi:MAG: YdcF family protein [Thiohalocapsa sp.]|jgi:uncharacterized SAM-binding protein YcdF (DUF218 family)|uniref:YdcF family protein n=1 Tax=Thiohalocapsa sp. TaxID=2497641 RepID=UPI0025EE7CBD|nr:YdcF family protein [Thiohalocapsa sp.]MCG6943085.1 YdcF family protein [Thiohalocapsa sp.]
MEAYTIIKQLLLPPGLLLLLLALAFFLVRGTLGRLVLFVAWTLLLAMSVPLFAGLLVQAAEPYPALTEADLRHTDAGAIVVLGAGVYSDAPEYGGTTVDGHSMVRSRYAAWLQRRTGLPIYLTGGSGAGAPAPAMRRFLEQELGVPVAAVEDASRNTWQNATFTAPMLEAAGIHRVLLVTEAWHMPRSVAAFERAGVEVVPAPTYFVSSGRRLGDDPRLHGGDRGGDWRNWLPQAKVWCASFYAIHELLGGFYYDLRARLVSSSQDGRLSIDADQ